MISVCMATFNGEKYLEEQLGSILPQLGEEDEVIVSDDGSTDDTLNIIRQFALRDSRIKLIYGQGKGVIQNFEHAIRQSTQPYIFLCDQDDIWFSNKVERILETFLSNPTIELVMSDLIVINDEKQVIEESYQKFRDCKIGFWHNFIKNGYIGAGIAFTSTLKERALPFPNKIPMHDMWLGLLAEKRGSSKMLNEPLVYYRKHESSFTQLKSSSSFYQKISWRLNLALILVRDWISSN